MIIMFKVKEPKIVVINKILPKDAEWRAIHGIADEYRGDMVDYFLRAVARTQGKIVLRDVENAMSAGEFNVAVNAIPWDTFEREMGKTGLVYRDIFQKAGQKSISFFPKDIQTSVSFDTLNPKSIEFIKAHTAKLVVEVTDQTKLAVREIMNRAFVDGIHPYESAKYIRQIVGLTSKQSLAVDNLRRRLVKQGVSQKSIDKQVDKYSHRLLVYRSKNISRTETIRAANEGQQALWQYTADQGLINRNTVKRKWIVTPDDRLCEWCNSLDGALVGLDEDFISGSFSGKSQTSLTPPLHCSCRCALGLVFE